MVESIGVRTRLIIIVGLLLLAIGATIAAAHATVGAVQNVHQHEVLKKREDVNLIQPWMTVPYVAHTYHVPERTLYQALHLQSNVSPTLRHSTLQQIATQQKRPVEQVIHEVQVAIQEYRKSHPARPPQPPPASSSTRGEGTKH